MSYEDWAYDQHMADLGREEELERAIEDISIEIASKHLGTFGDALEKRIRDLMDEAKVLLQTGHPSASLVLSITSLELLVRYFVLKPLVSGTFLTDDWAELLIERLVAGQSARDRELLPLIADEWGIDFKNIALSNGKPAWNVFVSDLIPRRHQFVHKGAPVPKSAAACAVECAEALFNGLLPPIAKKLQLSWPDSGAWHKVAPGVGTGVRYALYKPRDTLEPCGD